MAFVLTLQLDGACSVLLAFIINIILLCYTYYNIFRDVHAVAT